MNERRIKVGDTVYNDEPKSVSYTREVEVKSISNGHAVVTTYTTSDTVPLNKLKSLRPSYGR